MDSECIFCKIMAKELLVPFTLETDNFFVINDKFPKASTHLLIITKKHIATLNEFPVDPRLNSELFLVIKSLSEMLEIPAYKIQINVGKDGGQEVFHLHFHFMSNSKLRSIA